MTPNPRADTRLPAMKKPAKPTSDSPLFPHGNGRWVKKEGRRTRYYGPWVDPDGAFAAIPYCGTRGVRRASASGVGTGKRIRLPPAGQGTQQKPATPPPGSDWRKLSSEGRPLPIDRQEGRLNPGKTAGERAIRPRKITATTSPALGQGSILSFLWYRKN